MLTSTLLGLIVMALLKPRSRCSFCPMGFIIRLIGIGLLGKAYETIEK